MFLFFIYTSVSTFLIQPLFKLHSTTLGGWH